MNAKNLKIIRNVLLALIVLYAIYKIVTAVIYGIDALPTFFKLILIALVIIFASSRAINSYSKSQAKLEQDKLKSETERLQAEKEKIQAENERKHAESEKIKNETERLQAEKEKIQAENERKHVENETVKAKLEVDKVKSETERLQAEKEKIQAENERKHVENERKHIENESKHVENERIKEENHRKSEEEKQAKDNFDRLMRYLEEHCDHMGCVTESNFTKMLGELFGNRPYPGGQTYQSIAMGFAQACENKYFTHNPGWERPYLCQIAREEIVSVKQLLEKPDTNLMILTHVTSDEELLQKALDRNTEAKSVDVPAVLTKNVIKGNILYSPTPYGTNCYGNKNEDEEEAFEEIDIDSL